MDPPRDVPPSPRPAVADKTLGRESGESLARQGETMSSSAMANYAYDQIDHARTELNTLSI